MTAHSKNRLGLLIAVLSPLIIVLIPPSCSANQVRQPTMADIVIESVRIEGGRVTVDFKDNLTGSQISSIAKQLLADDRAFEGLYGPPEIDRLHGFSETNGLIVYLRLLASNNQAATASVSAGESIEAVRAWTRTALKDERP